MTHPPSRKRLAILLATAAICLGIATVVWVKTGLIKEIIATADPTPSTPVRNSELEEMQKFSTETRQLFNNRQFTSIEALADRLRTTREQFPSGAWKLMHAYDSLDCRDEEPESMWQLHEKIYQEWKTTHPTSITARVAHARFMISYAWHARGSDYADKVTEEGWLLFRERLASGRRILDESKTLAPCPVWWQARLRAALGQGEEPAAYEELFQQAKREEPRFFYHDQSRAYYLLPRWHGEAGDWEAAAEREIERPNGLGHEAYTRVIIEQIRFYGNIFQETNASWRKTKTGFEEMRARYSDTPQILNIYCRLACLAGDREQAKKLFKLIGEQPTSNCWRKKGNEFQNARNWAMIPE